MNNFVFFGTGGLLSSTCLEKIIQNKFIPKAVFIQKQAENLYPNLTELVCEKSKVNYHFIEDVNSESSLNLIKSYNPEFGVIASYGQIFKTPLIESFPIYNVHMGVLPYYRGAYTNFWKILNNDDIYGVTVHKIDERIDAGKGVLIIEQDFTHITLANDFFKANYEMAGKALIQVLASLRNKTVQYFEIDNSQGKYYQKHTASDMQLDKNENIMSLHKKINRLQFYGFPTIGNKQIIQSIVLYNENLKIEKPELIEVNSSVSILKNKTGVLQLRTL